MLSISVIVPIYYGEKYMPDIICQIENCSVYLEKEDYIEVLFVNDAPDAPISANVKSNLINIRIINSIHHTGIHGARVRGLKQSQGDYVLFLDQDDKIVQEYFQSQMQKLGNSDVVVCKALDGGKEFYIDDAYFLNIPYKQFALKEWNLIVSPGQVLIKKKSIPNMWIENILKNNYADDWFLWICMYASGCKFSLNEQILYEHILHDSNASDDTMGMLYSEQEMLGIIYRKKILSYYDFGLLLEGFYKKNYTRTQELYLEKIKLDCLDKWIKLREYNVDPSDYLLQLGIQRIAIYGCGLLGDYIYNELKTNIKINYFIDRKARYIQREIPVYTLEDILPETDAVIITLVGETKEIEYKLKERGFENIIILREWLTNNKVV